MPKDSPGQIPKLLQLNTMGYSGQATLQSMPAPVISYTREAMLLLTRRSEKQPPSRQGKSTAHLATGKYHTRTFINSSYKAKAGATRNQTGSCLISTSRAHEESKDAGLEAIRNLSVVNPVEEMDLTEEHTSGMSHTS